MSDLFIYPFLEILSESEAAARGVVLSERLIHALYKTIKISSGAKSARRSALYTIDISPLDMDDPPKIEKLAVLRKLIREKLVVQLFRLDHQGGMKLNVVSCYASIGEDERNEINEIYRETVARSVESIERLLGSFPPFNPGVFKKELDFDLNTEGDLSPDPGAISSSIPGVFDGITPGRFDIVPSAELLDITKKDIAEELVTRGRFITIPGYGLMPVMEPSLLERFHTAVEFMDERIIPLYRNRGNLQNRLEKIKLEEATYTLDEFAPGTASFAARRARALAEAMELTIIDENRRNIRLPGALTVHTIIALENRANEKLKEKKNEENNRLLSELKSKMLDPAASWEQMIVFLTESEYIKLPPVVREGLASDRRILYGTWQQPGQIIHVFLRNDPYAFRALVTGMVKLPGEYYWQVLAMRHLLDRYDEHFENLFRDPEFINLYGKLLRNVYISHMPWYHRFFLWLGVGFVQDSAFQYAKRKIQNQQISRSVLNKKTADKERARVENERRTKILGFKEKSTVNTIVEQLDRFYMQLKKIPSIVDLVDYLHDMDTARLREILIKENFQILPVKKDENPDNAIVLYPVDNQWRNRVVKLRRVAEEIKESLKSRPDGDFEKRLIESRLEKLTKKLNRSVSDLGKATSQDISEEEDPYRRFEAELKSYEEKSQKPPQTAVDDKNGASEDLTDPYFDDL